MAKTLLLPVKWHSIDLKAWGRSKNFFVAVSLNHPFLAKIYFVIDNCDWVFQYKILQNCNRVSFIICVGLTEKVGSYNFYYIPKNFKAIFCRVDEYRYF